MKPLSFSAEAKNKLLNYTYPGNVRELKAVIELAVVMCESNEILADDIRFSHLEAKSDLLGIAKTLREYTCEIVEHFLKKNDGDVLKTATQLDIGKSTIYNLIKNGEINDSN